MFYKSDIGIVKIGLCIKRGLEKKFDYVLIVSGDGGVGKTVWDLHFVEMWQKMIGKKVSIKLIGQVNVDKIKWLTKFKDIETYDINSFDEGAAGLGSKQYMETFSKTLEMLFQVIRYKRFLTVIIVPYFFRLNKFFREDRLRGLVWVDKRGHYKFLTKKRIVKLCNLNERKFIKRMDVIKPFHHSTFPDYDGILLEAYEAQKDEGVSKILDEVIEINNPCSKKISVVDSNKEKVRELLDKGKNQREISKELGIGLGTVNRCVAVITL